MRTLLTLATVLAIGSAVRAADPPSQAEKPIPKAVPKKARPVIETFTDPAKAGPDFALQGEYLGEAGRSGKIGAQVVAEGDGKFTLRVYRGGLPGDGWDGGPTVRLKATAADGSVKFAGGGVEATLADGKLALARDGETMTLLRVERKSPTLGMAPPPGAKVLFDGRSADGWARGQIVEGDLLKWGTTSKDEFRDFTLHLEFRTPFMPRATGQGRGNSGVYLQGRYEVQILDSFGLDGKDNECGGVYRFGTPKVNMCFPPLAWQTYDIDFTAAKFDPAGKKTADAVVTIRHNGVVIHDKLAVTGCTGGHPREEDGKPGPIFLQDHGNPVVFRNIWIVEK
jgi:hypothetical protein